MYYFLVSLPLLSRSLFLCSARVSGCFAVVVCVCDCVNYYLLLALRWAHLLLSLSLSVWTSALELTGACVCVSQHARFLVASIASHSPNSFACMGSSVSALVLFYFFTSPVALVDYS